MWNYYSHNLDAGDASMVAVDWQHGDFLGTIGAGQTRLWSAHSKDSFLDHGHGKFLIDAQGIHFHRMHGGETFIPFALIEKLELTKRHGSKYTVGNFITKVTWRYEGKLFESGFVFAKDAAKNAAYLQQINAASARLC